MQLLYYFIVVGVILETAAGIDDAGQAETIQLAHEMTRGIQLILKRQLGTSRQRCVQDAGVGFGEQQSDWNAASIAYDLATRGLRGVLRVADGPQGGGVQECAIIEVEQEDGKLMQQVSQKMAGVIDEFARKNGYTVVLDASEPVMWASESSNVTPDVIRLYDQKFPVAGMAPLNIPAAQPKAPAAPPKK